MPTAENWQQVQDIFHEALERERSHRPAFLGEVCAGNDDLRREVESLITAHEQENHFIDSPAYFATPELLTDSSQLKPGQTLGHYEIRSLLGEGGVGKVYLAEDKKLRRNVALKVLTSLGIGDMGSPRRLLLEAQAAAALDHPNICAVYEVDEESEQSYIAMQYIEGETLSTRLSRGRLSIDESTTVALQVTDALAEAHAHHIMHRDIKPSNIMLASRGQVKVLDFGLAKTTNANLAGADELETKSRLTAPGVILGTVPYMSPEQLRGKGIDARSDIFSFGVVLYEMLSGRQAFARDTDAETIGAILHQEPLQLSSIEADVPKGLEDVVNKCLAKDVGDRYQTIEQVAQELRAAQDPRTVSVVKTDRTNAGNRTTAATEAVIAPPTSGIKYLFAWLRHRPRALAFAAVAILVAVMAPFLYFSRFAKSAGNESIDSIAVLPFINVDNDPNKEYWSEGISDGIINNLSQLPNFKVMSLNSVLRYRGRPVEAQTVGRELQVGAVLISRLSQHGDDISITTELVDVRDNHRLWGDQYNAKVSDILSVQTQIAQQISEKLRLRLTSAQQQQVGKHPTDNPKAYELYILGNYNFRGQTKDGMQKSIDFYEQALKIDPKYALAYTGLGRVYFTLGMRGYLPPEESRQKAELAALKAVELDDSLAEGHAELGTMKEALDWDWTGAELEFKRALALNPNSSEALFLYGAFLVHDGRAEEAIPYFKRLNELDSGSANGVESYPYLHLRQFDKAIEIHLRRQAETPGGSFASFQLAEAYIGKGMYEEAIATMQKIIARDNAPERWDRYPILAYAYAAAGKRDEALKILAQQNEAAKKGYISPYNFAIIYTGLGDKDRAFDYLNKALETRIPVLQHFPSRPMFDPLHSDPRFADLVRRMNLPVERFLKP